MTTEAIKIEKTRCRMNQAYGIWRHLYIKKEPRNFKVLAELTLSKSISPKI